MKIKEKFNQYITGMRYLNNMAIVDTNFKPKWIVPTSKLIGFEKGDKNQNYYMFYSKSQQIDIDEILEYVKSVINLNLEREVKLTLLKEKSEELKGLFQTKSLQELQNLSFSFVIDKQPELDDLGGFDIMPEPTLQPIPEPIHEVNQPVNQHIKKDQPVEAVKQTKRGVNQSTERVRSEAEMREKRQGEPEGVKAIEGDFEKYVLPDMDLPPRQGTPTPIIKEKIETCNCPPDKMCPICAPSKGY